MSISLTTKLRYWDRSGQARDTLAHGEIGGVANVGYLGIYDPDLEISFSELQKSSSAILF